MYYFVIFRLEFHLLIYENYFSDLGSGGGGGGGGGTKKSSENDLSELFFYIFRTNIKTHKVNQQSVFNL